MARIAGVDLPNNKRGEIGLTYIYGIGRSSAKKILDDCGIDRDIKVGDWNDEQVAAIRNLINEDYKIEGAINYYGPEVAERMYDISFALRPGLPVQMTPEQVASHVGMGKKVTFYTCWSPQRPNTFTDSAPTESAFLGWYAAATGYSGYLRWA